MKVLIVFAHPEFKSFNGAMFQTAIATLKAAGHDVQYSDLYTMKFDPVSDRRNFTSVKDAEYFKQQMEELHATETGGFTPEIEAEMQKLECWVDRVFAMGRVYNREHIYETGRCRGKKAMLALTVGGTKDAYLDGGFNGDINAILRPIQRGILQFTGFDVLAPYIVYAPVRQTDAVRQSILDDFSQRLQTITHESPIAIGQY
jgi:NAD(P)H dehydrogenase (quinone)